MSTTITNLSTSTMMKNATDADENTTHPTSTYNQNTNDTTHQITTMNFTYTQSTNDAWTPTQTNASDSTTSTYNSITLTNDTTKSAAGDDVSQNSTSKPHTGFTVVSGYSGTGMASSKNGSDVIKPTAPVIHSGSSSTVGGIDQNLVIVGCIVGGLILLLVVAAAILCVRRKRQRKKTLKLIPPSILHYTTTSNGTGMIDSPSSPTINVSERLGLIRETSHQPGDRGAVSFRGNGAVAFHKREEEEEEEGTEYMAIWTVGEQLQQQQQQYDETDSKKASTSQTLAPPASTSDFECDQNVYMNFNPGASSTVNKNPQGNPSPLPDYDIEHADSPFRNRPAQTDKAHVTFHDSSPETPTPSDADVEENVYESYTPQPSPNTPRESSSGFYRVNGGYEHDMEHQERHTASSTMQDPSPINVTTKVGDTSNRLTSPTQSKKPQDQTSISSENYYEGNDPEPDYGDHPPMLSRDSGIGADHDSDSVYDVPSGLLDRLRNQYVINKPVSTRNSDNCVKPSPLVDGKNPSRQSETTESDYYMSPSADSKNYQLHSPANQNNLNYENTRTKRPDTYLGPDDIEPKSPEGEDEFLKVYDNFAFKAGNDANGCLYETSGELDQIYEMPTSTRSSLINPSSQDMPLNPNALQKALSSSMPSRVGGPEGGRASLLKSMSQESEYQEPRDLSEPNTTNKDSPHSHYMNSTESHYVNSGAHESEMDEAEYHTPNDISNSPFFKPIANDNNTRNIEARSLLPAFKPPPPRLYKPVPLETNIQREQGNTATPTSSRYPPDQSHSLPRLENDVPNKPTRKPLNVKSLTINTPAAKRDISPMAGRKKAVLPLDPSSPLLIRGVQSLSASQDLNDIREGEEDSSNVYLTPRQSVRNNNVTNGRQGRNTTKPSSGGLGNVDMGELHSAMKIRGLEH